MSRIRGLCCWWWSDDFLGFVSDDVAGCSGWFVWCHGRGVVDDGADRVPSCWMCACGSRFQTFEKGQEHVELFHRLPADIMLTGVVE